MTVHGPVIIPATEGATMAKLRHVAMVVDDIEKTATFYETAFGLQRVRELDGAVMLSDGVVSLAVIAAYHPNAEGRKGLHHFGFLIDDLEQSAERVEAAGGVYHGQINVGGARRPSVSTAIRMASSSTSRPPSMPVPYGAFRRTR
jgi:lactoylglutathione lyase